MAYEISSAFERIEDELIRSMIRNLKHHQAEETAEGFEWEQWQVAQLKELQRFKQQHAQKYGTQFHSMNKRLRDAIAQAHQQGMGDEEETILEAIKNGYKLHSYNPGLNASFFRTNERKLQALMNAVEHDMKTAQTAVLRYADDQYRRIIYDAQVAANTGAMTYEKAVDMATQDFLSKGINCIQYSNGAMVNIASYADMAIRTANKRAYLMGEGVKRQEWGITTVILNKRTNACPLCMPFEGKVLIDDVWSGGNASDGPYPLMSSAMAAGLYHPNCKDKHTTYFEGVSTSPERTFTRQELADIVTRQKLENKADYATRQVKRFERLEKYSLDSENKAKYGRKVEEWKQKSEELTRTLQAFEATNGFELAPSKIRQAKKAGEKVNITEQAISKVRLVDIPGYSEEENKHIQLLHKQLLMDSMKLNQSNEVAYILSKTGLVKVLGSQMDVEFDKSDEAVHVLSRASECELTILHNHPGGSSFSLTDINFFMKNKSVKTLTIVTNQGKVMYLTKRDNFNLKKAYLSAKKIDKSQYSTDEYVVNLLQALYNCGVKYKLR